MTIQDFLKEHGAEWSKIVGTPAFRAMLYVAENESPQHKSTDWTPGDVVVGGHILFAQMQGFTLLKRLMTEDLLLAPPEAQPVESYEEDPTLPPEETTES